MKSLTLFFSLFCLMLVSCSKETAQPVEPVVPDTTVAGALSVTRLDDTSANVSWPAAVPGATSVVIAWHPDVNAAARDTAQLAVAASSARLTGLDPLLDYSIVLTSRKADGDVTLMRGTLARVPLPPPSNPSRLEASSLSVTGVALKWTASTTVGATYLVSYRKVGATDTSSSATTGTTIVVNGTTATVTGLTAGVYTFHVFAVANGTMSSGTSLLWAPATRFTHDAANPSAPLRMYEFSSTNGSGLILDPAKGGPRNASVAASSPDPAGSVALAIFTEGGLPNYFDIGPAYAFLAFRSGNKFDSSAYISREGFMASSLDEHFLDKSLHTYITGGGDQAGNISAFNLPRISPDGKGIVFLMRIGNNPTHYARVLVKADETGKLLRGAAPNRYVEVEISYQTAANVPYAKRASRDHLRPGYTSRVLNPLP